MATYAKYLDKFQKKQGCINEKDKQEKQASSQETYVAFLEVQLEKVSQALITSKTFDERLEEARNRVLAVEDKLSTVLKLVKFLQSFADSQEIENAQIREKVTVGLCEFGKRLAKIEISEGHSEFEGRLSKIERKIDRTQSSLDENLQKIEDNRTVKEFERSLSSLDQKLEKKLEEIIGKGPSSDFFEKPQKDLEKRLSDEIILKMEELTEKMEGLLEEKIGNEKMERISAFENLQTQNFQREQILSNLTDELMGKFESLEHNKGNEFSAIEGLKMQIKENCEKNEKENKEIRECLNEMAIKMERQNRNLDKTFSFQENGNTVTRRDFEELERKIADKMEENFSKTNDMMLNSMKLAEKTRQPETSPMLILSEISPNKLAASTDSELDKVLFRKSKKKANIPINTLLRNNPASFRETSPLSSSKSPADTARISNYLENTRDMLAKSNDKSMKSSTDFRASSMRNTRSFSRTSDKENEQSSIRKKSKSREKSKERLMNKPREKSREKPRENSREKSKENLQKKGRNSGKNKENSREKDCSFDGSETGGSIYTKSMKFDMNFSNSGSIGVKRRKDSLISEKYKKLEKIYESLSKE